MENNLDITLLGAPLSSALISCNSFIISLLLINSLKSIGKYVLSIGEQCKQNSPLLLFRDDKHYWAIPNNLLDFF